jgi:lipopolysaccharide biosynthesis regulator YciM
MLGNQFFMARNYPAAQKEFENIMLKNHDNLSIKKKLLICYTQTGKLTEAINLFSELINENMEFVLNTDPVRDDCPCAELIEKIEKQIHPENNNYEILLVLAIIWLYCDEHKSLEYFKKLNELDPLNKIIEQSIEQIETYISTH